MASRHIGGGRGIGRGVRAGRRNGGKDRRPRGAAIEALESRQLFTAGPVLVEDVYPGASSGAPTDFATLDGKLYFAADDATHGRELYVHDPAAGTTTRLSNFAPANGSTAVGRMYAFDDRIFYAGNHSNGLELWCYDPAGGTNTEVANINGGAANSGPADFYAFNGKMYFSADDGTHGTELWVYDPLADSASLLKDVNTLGAGTANGSVPRNFIGYNGKLYFSAYSNSYVIAPGVDGVADNEVWQYDPAAAPGTEFTEFDLSADTVGSAPLDDRAVVNGKLYFTAADASGEELWSLDTLGGAPTRVTDINAGGSAAISAMVALGNSLYFRATDGGGTTGAELYTFDAVAGTASLAYSVRAGTPNSSPAGLTAIGGKLYFRANDGTAGTEPWVYDPADGTAHRLADVSLGAASSQAKNFVGLNGQVYFAAATDGVGVHYVLHAYDPVADAVSSFEVDASVNSWMNAYAAIGNTLYTVTADAAHGEELFELVTAGAANAVPAIGGEQANQAVNDNATVAPLAAITVTDADTQAMDATVVVVDGVNRGDFTGGSSAGWTRAVVGNDVQYTRSFASAADIGATVQAAVRALVFQPRANAIAAGATETTAFTVAVTDAAAATASSASPISVVATSVNDAPTVTGAAAGQAVNDNATVSPFSGVTLADVDSPAQTLAVTVTLDAAAKGALSNLGGGSYNAGTGVYAFTGTAAAATTALRGLVFTPAANRVAPTLTETTTFTVAADDGATGSVSNAATTVVATSVNDAPGLTGAVAGQAVNDNATIAPLAAVTLGDADSPAQTLSVSVTLDAAAKGALSNLGGGSYDAGAGVYTFTGTAADATTALRGLVFTPAANRVAPGGTETTTLTVAATDGAGGALSNPTATVVSTSVNDAPIVGGAAAGQAVNDNATVSPFAAVTFGDVDNPAQTLAVSVTLDAAAKGALSNLGGGSYDASTGVYTFSGTAADAQAAVRGLVFTPAANRVTPGATETTTFSIALDDGAAGTASDDTTTVVSTSINDAPTVGGTVAGQAVNDDATLSPLSAVTVGDVDSPAQTLTATVTLDAAAKGALSNLGGGSYDAGAGVYTFTGTAADATTALRGLVFAPAANRVSAGLTETTTFTVAVNDAVAAVVTDDATTVVATSINDAPVLAGGGTGTIALTGTDEDTTTAGVTAGSLASAIGVLDDDVHAAGLHLSIAITGTTGNGTWQYSADGTDWTDVGAVSDAAALLVDGDHQIRYVPDSTDGETAGITFRAWDMTSGTASALNDRRTADTTTSGGGTAFSADPATATLAVSAVNDAPVNTVPAAQSVNEDATLVLSTGNGNAISVDDVDVGIGLLRLTVSVGHGTLTLADTTGLFDFTGDGTGSISAEGTAAALNAALDGLTYAPAANYNGADTLEVDVNDEGATGSGPEGVDSDTVAITVNPTNDNPSGANDTITLAEDAAATAVDVLANDAITPDAGETLTITAVTQGGHGTVVITNGGTGLTYQPASNYNGADSFTYTVSDGNGGTATATVAVSVTAVNDAPVALVPATQTTDEGAVKVFSTAGGNGIVVGDVEATQLTITLAATHGTLTIEVTDGLNFATGSGEADATMTFTGSPADVNAALQELAFLPDAGFSGTGNVTITVSDGGSTGAGGTLTTTQSIDVTVREAGTLAFDPATYAVDEDDNTATVTVVRTGGTAGTVMVNVATVPGASTAVAGTHYTAVADTLIFLDGQTTKTVTVPLTNNALDEADRTIGLALSGATRADLGTATSATITVADDDAAPTVSVAGGGTVTEGDTGQTPATVAFTIALSAPSGKTVTVDYATSFGTATAADLTAASGTLTFAPGETSKTVNVTVAPDALDEVNESFTLGISNAANATLDDDSAAATIADDDVPPTVGVVNADVNEGTSGTIPAVFVVTLSAPSGKTITIDYATADDATADEANRALAGTDYDPAAGTLTFAPGETSKTVNVVVNGDMVDEVGEVFDFDLSNVSNASIADGHAVGSILNASFNHVPFAGDETVTRKPGQWLDVDVLANDGDVDGDALTITIVTAPTGGSATVNDHGTPADRSDDTVVYQPGAGVVTDDAFTYKVDDGNGHAVTATVTVHVRGAGLDTDPEAPGKQALFIATGDDSDHVIEIEPVKRNGNNGNAARVSITTDGEDEGTFTPTGRIVITGGAGNDTVDAAGSRVAVEFYGGDGDDTLVGSNKGDILVGGPGADTITGGRGRDILIGGGGADTLRGLDLGDVLIAGTTDYDADTAANRRALGALMNAWSYGTSYAQRVRRVTGNGGAGVGPMGARFSTQTIHDDGAADTLFGDEGGELFIARTAGGGVVDTVNGRGDGETLVEMAAA